MAARTQTKKKAVAQKKEPAFFEDVLYFLNGTLRLQSEDLMELLISRILLANVEFHHINGGKGLEYYELVRDKYKFSFDQKTNAQIIGIIMDYDGYREFKGDDREDDG